MGLSAYEFNRLIADHGEALFRLAYRLVGNRTEAEDLVQETYRSVWKGRETYREGHSPRAWMASILRRRAADAWRKRSAPFVYAEDASLDAVDPHEAPESEPFSDEIQQALAKLPEELRTTLLLVVVGELTHQEAAEVLKVPLGTVLSRVSRARSRLREYLGPALAKSLGEDSSSDAPHH
ncbi:MAG TPA: RNA polymerase sigma factor [Pirellulales bacterium]